MTDFDFDVFGVTETWLHPADSSKDYAIPGFTLLRCDRQPNATNTQGGGVGFYIKESFVYERHYLAEDIDSGIEYVCIVLDVKGVKTGVCAVYKPPHLNYTRLAPLFHALFVDLAVCVTSVICVGDLNIDLFSRGSPNSNYLRRLLKEHNAIQLINEPTRILNNSATLLDHIIVDKSAKVKRIGVMDAPTLKDHRGVSITDHKLVHMELEVKKEKKEPKMISYRDFSKFDIEKAIDDISRIDWERGMDMDDVNELENFITTNIKNVYNKHAPIVCKRVIKGKAPWRNHKINALTTLKNKLRKKYWKSRLDGDWQRYKSLRNQLNKEIRKAKKIFFSEKLSSVENPKEFWSYIKESNIAGKNIHNVIPPNIGADEINEHFAKMGLNCEANKSKIVEMLECQNKEERGCFHFKDVTRQDVIDAMNSIQSKAVGSDDISIQMVKAVSPYAIGAITHLVNLSLLKGVFPENWKTSIIHPLPKVSAPTEVKELRPISILPAISKILEKIVASQIMSYIDENNILPKLQSGSRKNHSTCTALINLLSDMYDAKDQRKCSTMVSLDYSQAYDSIDYDVMVAKMKIHGFDEISIAWMNSYLRNRLQVTKLGVVSSRPAIKLRGVPQGSCLGPILFILYTADLPSCVEHCTLHQYVDDCQLHLAYDPKAMEVAIENVNLDLQKICRWSVDNGLMLNISKCAVMHIAPQNLIQALNERGLRVVADGEEIPISNKIKTLGVIIDNGLTLSDHVTATIQKAVGRLRGLYRFRNLLPEAAKLHLVQSLILSAFYYCYPAYGNSISKGDSERIQKLQNTTIRFVYQLRRYDHVSEFRDAANLLLMETMCRMQTCATVHKVLTLGEPQYLSERLRYREEVALRNTRNDKRLHFPRVTLEVGRKSFSFFGPMLYNDLPDEIRTSPSINSFKSKMKRFVLAT